MNSSQVSSFTLSGYTDTGLFRFPLFLVVLLLYVLIVAANVAVMLVICVNRSLHEPMYMFLCSLFVNELYGSTGLFPSLLVQILSDLHTVPAPLCFLQVYCLYSYGGIEFLSLAIMSYDRYLAICFPLRYHALMTLKRVGFLTALIWLYPLFINMVFVSWTVRLQLCGNVINKVYCDNFYIVRLSCSDTTAYSVFGLVHIFTVIFGLFLLILYTYMRILWVCCTGSKLTRRKAVSTCTPHLVSLLNFFSGSFFEIIQSRFNMSRLPNAMRIFFSLYWLTSQPLASPLLYGLNVTKIRDVLLTIAHLRAAAK
ncbi:olfactory receptor 1038-like [Mugil cephalus]|uniref:olfactory receptor 1038-like n=1 Tax=Mugil cephalus TaxID=48193 RepID=UPI001FB607E3|nr:olfactory receptor 1038-like [Mugil cephalus]